MGRKSKAQLEAEAKEIENQEDENQEIESDEKSEDSTPEEVSKKATCEVINTFRDSESGQSFTAGSFANFTGKRLESLQAANCVKKL